MKRLLLFMLVIFAFVACTQDVMNEQNAVDIATPDTITVGFEGSDTRIQLNEAMKTVWNKGDQVSVFYKSFDNLKYEFQGNTGDRDGVLKKVDGTWGGQTMHQTTIVYPYNTNYLVSTNGNIETILPSIQHYTEGSYGIGDNLMVAQSEFNNFSLRNTCGWLRLHLTGDGQKVKSIKFIGNNDEQVAGLVYVNTANAELTLANSVCDVPFDDESGELAPGGVDGNFFIEDVISKGVTLDLGDGVELNDESKAFYIALPPQTFEQGFTVEIECEDNKITTLSTENLLVIDRNHIQPMHVVNIPKDDNVVEFNVNGVKFNMIKVDGGTFMMGGIVATTITKTYYIGETEVTQALWNAVMGISDSDKEYDNFPVNYITFNETQTFIAKLNEILSTEFRLPSEAEWEFAAKGGIYSKGYIYAGSNDADEVAWYYDNSPGKVREVATKLPNELGIYDMCGNVLEWCNDYYGSLIGGNDPTGPTSGRSRVNRGGDILGDACPTSKRNYSPYGENAGYRQDGFRLAIYL